MRLSGGSDERERETGQNVSPRPPFSRSRTVPLRRLAWLGVVLIVLGLLTMTLWRGRAPNAINLIPFQQKWPALVCLAHKCAWALSAGVFLFVDVLGNLVVFVPFGAALAVATLPPSAAGRRFRNFGSRWWLRIVAAGFLFSLGIELTQLLIPGHTTDVDDVIFNTLGAAIGSILVWGLCRLTSNQ
jgi:glycopeptide antibiotics resistance protein